MATQLELNEAVKTNKPIFLGDTKIPVIAIDRIFDISSEEDGSIKMAYVKIEEGEAVKQSLVKINELTIEN